MTGNQTLQLVTTIISVIAIATGLPGLILFALNKRGANKKLTLEEEAQDGNTFEIQRKAYLELYKEAKSASDEQRAATSSAQAATRAALEELADFKRERAAETREIKDKLDDTNAKLETVRSLLQSVVSRSNIILTKEEQFLFDQTIPVRRGSPRKRPA